MKLKSLVLLPILILISACSAPDTAAPMTPTLASTKQTAATSVPATLPVVSTRTDRRAPTLAPTVAATATARVTPTEIPTATAAATNTTIATVAPTETVRPTTASQPIATATPAAAAGVYVTSFQLDPPAPKSKPAQFVFHVGFLNTVGQVVNYPRWRVLIIPKGQTKAQGDPQGESKTIANGASNQNTEVWSIKVITGCETYTAQPVWQDEDGRQTPFTQPDGKPVGLEFQVCA